MIDNIKWDLYGDNPRTRVRFSRSRSAIVGYH